MKKEAALLGIFLLITTLLVGGVFASEESEKVDQAYECLENQIDDKGCSSLSVEEKVFALLSTGECKTELLQESPDGTCWPSSSNGACTLEMTSKAALALDSVNADTELATDWLLDNKGISTDLDWFLEVDSNRPLSCTVGYEAGSLPYDTYEFEVDNDKKISGNPGECLSITNNDFWFSIEEDCYQSEYDISCNESFISTLIYKKKDSGTYYISDNVHSSSGGSTTEKIDSYCLLDGSSCDYPGTLWGSFVLDYLEENVSSFFPYLITSAEDNPGVIPESLLYILTDRVEYKTDLLNKQTTQGGNSYWQVFGGRGKYYDTALALLPFQGESLVQKDNSKDWLLSVQQENGCWDNNNIVTNGFLLYSIWTETGINGGGGSDILCSEVNYECVGNSSDCSGDIKDQYLCSGSDVCCDPDSSGPGGPSECEFNGYTCESLVSCDGEILSEYECPGIKKCCDTEPSEETCSNLNGDVCSNNEYCSGGEEFYTDELSYGDVCCVGGFCDIVQTEQTCEDQLGYCSSSCDSGYEETNLYGCDLSGDVCCIESEDPGNGGTSYWWIWALLALVVVVVVGILYKDKLRDFLQKMKARRKGPKGGPKRGPPGGLPPRYPPSYGRSPRVGAPRTRRIPPRQSPPPQSSPRPPMRKKPSKELDDVLKKLKEIGK